MTDADLDKEIRRIALELRADGNGHLLDEPEVEPDADPETKGWAH